jgi:hypothetical protein
MEEERRNLTRSSSFTASRIVPRFARYVHRAQLLAAQQSESQHTSIAERRRVRQGGIMTRRDRSV